jgi:probable rRNA maturation factor
MIEFFNKKKVKIDYKSFDKIGQIILKDHKKDGFVSVAFINSKEMQKQNNRYRKKNKTTDVISVNLENSNFDKKQNWLGEILICKSVVDKNAKEYQEDKNRELLRVFIHGLLHVLGYDHELGDDQERVFRDKEEYYLSKSF